MAQLRAAISPTTDHPANALHPKLASAVSPGTGQGGDIVIEVLGELISKPYIDITLNLLQRFGVAVQREGWQAASECN